jgi:hypothetical protein
MSSQRAIFKCVFALLVAVAAGLVASILGVYATYALSSYVFDGGMLLSLGVFWGVAMGLSGGIVVSRSIWKHRKNADQSKVKRTAKGWLLLVCALAFLPSVLIIPLARPPLRVGKLLSIGVILVLAGIDVQLFRHAFADLTNR